MKVNSNLILKPGAILEPVIIDHNDPKIRDFIEKSLKEQKRVLKYGKINRKTLDSIITI